MVVQSQLERKLIAAFAPEIGDFETNVSSLLGTPDIVFEPERLIIFVHGCYWHRHAGCENARVPRRNFVNWLSHFNSSVIRDNQIYAWHESQGWEIFVTWECEIQENVYDVAGQILRRVNERRPS